MWPFGGPRIIFPKSSSSYPCAHILFVYIFSFSYPHFLRSSLLLNIEVIRHGDTR